MKKIASAVFLIGACCAMAQTTLGTSREWIDNSNWTGGTYPGTFVAPTLTLSNQTIVIDHYTRIGDWNNDVNLTFVANNEAFSITANNGDTLIIYGNVSFGNKAMDFIIGINSVVVILGDLYVDNNLDVESGGLLVVTGTFTKVGGGGSFDPTGDVYGSTFDGPGIDSFVPPADQTPLADLETDYPGIWDFINNGGIPLPAELTSFTVRVNENHGALNWQTASELNNDRFELERSDDGQTFYHVATISGHGTTNETQNYRFNDTEAIMHLAYYRLKQVDFDGAFEYSKVIVGYADKLASLNFKLFPNPASEVVFLKSDQPMVFKHLQLINLAGQKVIDLVTTNSDGFQTKIPLPSLESGYYFIQYETSSGQRGAKTLAIK